MAMLPEEFADLEPFAGEVVPGHRARAVGRAHGRARWTSMQAFYDAAPPSRRRGHRVLRQVPARRHARRRRQPPAVRLLVRDGVVPGRAVAPAARARHRAAPTSSASASRCRDDGRACREVEDRHDDPGRERADDPHRGRRADGPAHAGATTGSRSRMSSHLVPGDGAAAGAPARRELRRLPRRGRPRSASSTSCARTAAPRWRSAGSRATACAASTTGGRSTSRGCVVECPTQTVRAEQFAASVPVVHFPVHESGGLAWVWLGARRGAAVPRAAVRRRGPVPLLVRVAGAVQLAPGRRGHDRLGPRRRCCTRPGSPRRPRWPSTPTSPSRSTSRRATRPQSTPYGMRAAALRKTADGRTYVRITEHLMPLVTVVPVGGPCRGPGRCSSSRRSTTPTTSSSSATSARRPQRQDRPTRSPCRTPDFVPDPRDYTGLRRRPAERLGPGPRPHGRRATSPASGAACSRRTPSSRRAWGRSSTAPRRTSPPATSPWPTPAGCCSTRCARVADGELPPGSARRPDGVAPAERRSRCSSTRAALGGRRARPGQRGDERSSTVVSRTGTPSTPCSMTYAEHVDAGRFAEVGALFEHATYRIEHADGVERDASTGAPPRWRRSASRPGCTTTARRAPGTS